MSLLPRHPLVMFYDTETTGFPKKGRDLYEQPYMVQLAAEVWDPSSQQVVHSISFVIDNGVDIPSGAAEVHGWTTELVKKVGVSPKTALDAFLESADRCGLFVGHNEQFDAQILGFSLARGYHEFVNWWNGHEAFCTMEAMRNVCRLPPTAKMKAAGFDHFKSPKLSEAYSHCFGKNFEGAHNALADVQATRKVYTWLKNKQMDEAIKQRMGDHL